MQLKLSVMAGLVPAIHVLKYQRSPRRRRLQLPPPDPMAQAFVAPNPDRYRCSAATRSNLKSAFFTND
jgi:hypothetical protein